jgi:hypothetical protein
MNTDPQGYMNHYLSDGRLKVYHLSLLLAIMARMKEATDPIHISRRLLMGQTGIRSTRTYHKYIAELIEFGYLLYKPSYHPKEATQVRLKIKGVKKTLC